MLGTLKILPSGIWKEKPRARKPVGESVLSFPVIIMIFWQPFFCNVLAANLPPSKLSEEIIGILGVLLLHQQGRSDPLHLERTDGAGDHTDPGNGRGNQR